MTAPAGSGKIQLLLVIAFIVASVTISKMLATSYEAPKRNTEKTRELVVETVIAQPQEYRITLTTTGTINARSEVNIVPQVSGRIVEMNENFYTGGTFAKDELLFKIEPEDFELDVKRLEAEVAKARTAYDLEQAESEAALAEWKQVNKKKKAPDLVARKPQLAEAEANLKAAEAQLNNAKLALKRTTFDFPFNGKVLSSNLGVGQYVMAGQSYGSVFDNSSLEITASLRDNQLEWIMQSEKPEILIRTTHLGKKQVHKGMITRKSLFLDTNTRFMNVYIGFADDADTVVPGLFSEITINSERLKDVYVLPATALQDNNIIWQLNYDSISAITPEIIFQNETELVVKSLPSGTEIVTSKLSGATEGMKVKSVKAEQ